MDRVRDPRTGAYFQYSAPGDAQSDELLLKLLHTYPGGAPDVQLVTAVLDTGVLHDHPLIKGRVIAEVDFTGEGAEDLSGHGTMVVLNATRGVATQSSHGLLNIKVADRTGRGTPANLIRGLDWLTNYKAEHTDQIITANLSVGVYRRRLLGMLPCDGTCDVCSAALRASEAGILVIAAAGNTTGKTACPATAGLKVPNSGIAATTLVGPGLNLGIGQLAVSADSLPEPVPIPEPEASVTGLAGEQADAYLLGLAEQFSNQGDDVQAEKVLEHLRRYGGPEARSIACVTLGLRAADKGRLDDAKELLQAGIGEDNPDKGLRAQSLYVLGYVTEAQGKWGEAARYLQQAVKTEHAHFAPLAAQILANKLVADGDFQSAIPYLNAAAVSDDSEVAAQARYNRACIARRLGRREAAYSDYRRVASVPSRLQGKAQLGLGSMLAGEGHLREALDWLRSASLSADPGVSARALLGLGDIAVALGEHQNASHYFSQAINSAYPEISAVARTRMERLQ
jgi:tetratricopeptide (TPR) repeat protein